MMFVFMKLKFSKPRPTNKSRCGKELALDCGAGIGRVTKNLLLKNFKNVDMVDVTENFIKTAREYLGDEDSKRVLNFYCSGLQNFQPDANKYDCIWIQWVTGDTLFHSDSYSSNLLLQSKKLFQI